MTTTTEPRRRYRLLALQVVSADTEADSPEEADALLRTYSPDNFTHEAWIDTVLCVETAPGSDEFDTVAEWTQPDLWTSVLRVHETTQGERIPNA